MYVVSTMNILRNLYLPAIDDAAADGAPPSHTFEFSSNFAYKEITKIKKC